MISLFVAVLVLLLFVLFGVVAFNRLRAADIGAQEALGGIDVHLTRRADLVPPLVESVKRYVSHEAGVLSEVTQARGRVQQAAAVEDVAAKAAADATLGRSLAHLNAVAESYPELAASATFLDLQRQLGESEDQIAFARQYYNDAVGTLNTLTRTIPWMFFTGVAGVGAREFYEAPAADQGRPEITF